MQREALRVLREQMETVASYLGSHEPTRNRRLAVLATIRDLEKTHAINLTPKDALLLWNITLPPLQDPMHSMRRKHFFDFFRYLSKEYRNAKARALKFKDDLWPKKIDPAKADQIRGYIKSNSFPDDLCLEDVVQVASRINDLEFLS